MGGLKPQTEQHCGCVVKLIGDTNVIDDAEVNRTTCKYAEVLKGAEKVKAMMPMVSWQVAHGMKMALVALGFLEMTCPKCQYFDDDVYYAPTCGFTTWTCYTCGYKG